MDPITVFRHGDRWAVREEPGRPPTAEYETREAAVSAANHRAEGREVVVEDDPGDQPGGHGGGVKERDGHVEDVGLSQRTGGGGSGHQTPSEPQAGL